MKPKNFRNCGGPWRLRYFGLFKNHLKLVNSIPEGQIVKHFEWRFLISSRIHPMKMTSQLRCDNFDLNFKNLIGGPLDTWPKTDFAPCFEGTNNDFLKETN